jgi:hypothetical protein
MSDLDDDDGVARHAPSEWRRRATLIELLTTGPRASA